MTDREKADARYERKLAAIEEALAEYAGYNLDDPDDRRTVAEAIARELGL